MSWDIPLTDVILDEDDIQAVGDCLRSGWLTMGPRTKAFEEAVAQNTGLPHAVAVNSGTAALHLACAALNLGPGDEVIVPAFTFLATANAPRYRGATPVLCDVISPQNPNIDPEDVARKLTPRTKAIIAVHMLGYPADLEGLKRFGLPVIEDAAQGFGVRNLGDVRPHVPELLLQEAARGRRGRDGADARRGPTRRACGCCARTR